MHSAIAIAACDPASANARMVAVVTIITTGTGTTGPGVRTRVHN